MKQLAPYIAGAVIGIAGWCGYHELPRYRLRERRLDGVQTTWGALNRSPVVTLAFRNPRTGECGMIKLHVGNETRWFSDLPDNQEWYATWRESNYSLGQWDLCIHASKSYAPKFDVAF